MAEPVRLPGSNAYFTRRESQERRMADRAIDRAVRNAHLNMAERYKLLAREDTVLVIAG